MNRFGNTPHIFLVALLQPDPCARCLLIAAVACCLYACCLLPLLPIACAPVCWLLPVACCLLLVASVAWCSYICLWTCCCMFVRPLLVCLLLAYLLLYAYRCLHIACMLLRIDYCCFALLFFVVAVVCCYILWCCVYIFVYCTDMCIYIYVSMYVTFLCLCYSQRLLNWRCPGSSTLGGVGVGCHFEPKQVAHRLPRFSWSGHPSIHV